MSIPNNITKEHILHAIEYIDKNGVPPHNQSMTYNLIGESGEKYPPKYVVSVANHFVNGTEISKDLFNSIGAISLLEKLGFVIENNQKKYSLVITADNVTSTDENFSMENLALGNNYTALDTYYKSSREEVIRRKRNKGEKKISNQTMPRLACQIFEESIAALPVEEKENFPICQYSPESEMLRGIFFDENAFKEKRNSWEYVVYHYGNKRKFVFYCWNVFSTIHFVQECLKRFGEGGDEFVLIYREKAKNEEDQLQEELSIDSSNEGAINPYSKILLDSKNIIFRGAPGTGKTYLAKEVAADIISDGYFSDYHLLSEEQKKQIEFVQFHPGYDYSDFVEGLRPKINNDGSMGFVLQDGIFKRFVARARKNFDDSQRSQQEIEQEASVNEMLSEYFSNLSFEEDELEILNGRKFFITDVDEKYIYIVIPENKISNQLKLKLDELKQMLESEREFNQVKDVTSFFNKTNATQHYSYQLAIFNDIKEKKTSIPKAVVQKEKLKPYIFIIDEINRGEISKIFGELFFSIDPGYRGVAGRVSTQYANLHEESDEKFYIPENVYIIGTMNDIDRSVDSFDFAMRRRFRFVEIKADERLEMLDDLGESKKEEAIQRMIALNKAISKVEELNENYHIGASYFLKLKHIGFEELWRDYLCPLLQDYVRGMYDEQGIMKSFENAFFDHGESGEMNDGSQD